MKKKKLKNIKIEKQTGCRGTKGGCESYIDFVPNRFPNKEITNPFKSKL